MQTITRRRQNELEEKMDQKIQIVNRPQKESCESIFLAFVVGITLRVLCFIYAHSYLVKRPELTSPLVSYRRLQDGVALFKDNISPYEGDLFHFQPILLRLCSLFDISDGTVFAVFIGLDSLTALLLSISAAYYAKEGGSAHPEHISVLVFKCYFWNPITVACTAVLSVSVLHNVLIAVVVYFFCSGILLPCVAVLSFCTSLSVYPVIIVASVLLRFPSVQERVFSLFALTFGFTSTLVFNWLLNGMSWSFIEDTYGFILRADDHTPNVGLFWYFFIQVFEHFRAFYLVVFQINLLVYVVPLLLSLRKDAHLHLVVSLLLMAVFSSYPTLNDASTYLALLPMLEKYRKYPRYTLVVGCTLVTCVVLMPVMWHMWIVGGSGNANFYFAVTLIYNIAQIYLLIDLMFAYFRKEVDEASASLITSKTNFVLH